MYTKVLFDNVFYYRLKQIVNLKYDFNCLITDYLLVSSEKICYLNLSFDCYCTIQADTTLLNQYNKVSKIHFDTSYFMF